MNVTLCLTSGKHRYPTWAAAVGPALRSSKRAGRPMRVYKCPECRGFHMTKRAEWKATG